MELDLSTYSTGSNRHGVVEDTTTPWRFKILFYGFYRISKRMERKTSSFKLQKEASLNSCRGVTNSFQNVGIRFRLWVVWPSLRHVASAVLKILPGRQYLGDLDRKRSIFEADILPWCKSIGSFSWKYDQRVRFPFLNCYFDCLSINDKMFDIVKLAVYVCAGTIDC